MFFDGCDVNLIQNTKRKTVNIQNTLLKVNEINHYECRYISLRRALRNIIDNGLRYGKKVIIIVTNRNKRQLNITIRDNGPGIPEQYLKDVLKPFFDRLTPLRERFPRYGH